MKIKYYKFVKFIDKYFSIIMFYVFNIILHIAVVSRGALEDYIIKNQYSNMSQFERFLTTEQENNLVFQIDKRMTWIEIHDKILEISLINLSKRQCYKLKKMREECR